MGAAAAPGPAQGDRSAKRRFLPAGRGGVLHRLEGREAGGHDQRRGGPGVQRGHGEARVHVRVLRMRERSTVRAGSHPAGRRVGRRRGLFTLGGPFNLDYEDAYGVLIEGRDRPPVILCGHTPPYYQGFFEGSGFAPLRGDNLAYEVPLDEDSPALKRTAVLADRIRQRGWITIRTPDLSRWTDEVGVVQELMNRSMAHLADFRPWEREAVAGLLEPFKSIADPDLILFAQIEGKTVGWFPGVANMNEVLIHLDGLRRPWDVLRALRWMRYNRAAWPSRAS